MDAIFKALADPSRRSLLDRLHRRNGQSLRELCAGLDMARQSVTKHLAVLEAAGLVQVVWRGRERLHYLNAAPINEIADRWIGRFHRERARALADLSHALEGGAMSQTDFFYATYIRTTPEQLWKALTDPSFTMRYMGAGLISDWRPGSPVLWQFAPGEAPRDLEDVVLEAEPFRRLSYSWHNYQPEHRELFGWTEERYSQLRQEKRSRVTFEIEPLGSMVKLTVIHDGFEGDTEMLKAVSGRLKETGGWPEVLASLKSLMETGEPLGDPAAEAPDPAAAD